jgi:hypothetical protein
MLINDLQRTGINDLGLVSTHEWTKPPQKLILTVMSHGLVCVRGELDDSVIELESQWNIQPAEIQGIIDNLQNSAESFREINEDNLNNIDSLSIDEFFRSFRDNPNIDWEVLHENSSSDANWNQAAVSIQLRYMAFYGYKLYRRFFEANTELGRLIDSLPEGSRIDISWCKSQNHTWLPHVPWGLMFQTQLPETETAPIDPLNFLGLKYRLGYKAYRNVKTKKALGLIDNTNRVHLLHWGTNNNILLQESTLQRNRWDIWPNQSFAPTVGSITQKEEIVTLLREPNPKPVSLLYLFCRCNINGGRLPILQFGDTSNELDTISEIDLSNHTLHDNPLVFVNACTTITADPYITNELERNFFERGCRGYIGTETKVPIILASRFAEIFFHFFYNSFDERQIAVGEAFFQTKIFLWRFYKNIGGLFYGYVGEFELFMTSDDQISHLRR